MLLPKSKPVSAATVRCGPGYLEVPFFATHDSHRWGSLLWAEELGCKSRVLKGHKGAWA